MNNIKLQGIDIDGIEKEYSLNDFKGQKVILYFYPKIIRQVVHKKRAILEIT